MSTKVAEADAISPELLLQKLIALERRVQAKYDDLQSFKQANSCFDPKNETTQLLMKACEKLLIEKANREHANFAEHTSELRFLLQYYGCDALDMGLSDTAYRERVSTVLPSRLCEVDARHGPFRFFGFCCQLEFPPQQAWWLDICKRLVPQFLALRGGKLIATGASEIVPGDIIYLCAGQKSAADGRILVCAEGTTVDASHATRRAPDVRTCSVESTAVTPVESCNIVLKDSYLVTGAVFYIIVRAPKNSFISDGNGTASEEGAADFTVNTALPPGMSLRHCQRLFKSLCLKAHLACRSFWAVSRLSQARAVVVLLDKELLGKGTVPKFCTAVRKLEKALVLVNCGCATTSLRSLCQELGIEIIDFHKSEDKVESKAMYQIDGGRPGEEEQGHINVLAEQLVGGNGSGKTSVVLNGISQGGLLLLCQLLRNVDRPLLYAMSGFHFPRCFQSLRGLRISTGDPSFRQGPTFASPRASLASTEIDLNFSPQCEGSATPQASRALVPCSSGTPDDSDSPFQAHRPAQASETVELSVHPPSRGNSIRSQVDMAIIRSHDPVDMSTIANSNGRSQEASGSTGEVVVSLNSIGVVSEYADCVLLKSDLGLLGQALEIVHKR